MTEWRPVWDVGRDGRGVVQSARCARQPDVDRSLPEGCCEFVGGLVYVTFDGRTCADGTFCPARIFRDPKVFVGCPTRLEKLRDRGLMEAGKL